VALHQGGVESRNDGDAEPGEEGSVPPGWAVRRRLGSIARPAPQREGDRSQRQRQQDGRGADRHRHQVGDAHADGSAERQAEGGQERDPRQRRHAAGQKRGRTGAQRHQHDQQAELAQGEIEDRAQWPSRRA